MQVTPETAKPAATLSHHAPSREWVTDPNGKWYSRPWTEAGVLECRRGGGWFARGLHSFDCLATSVMATAKTDKPVNRRVAKPLITPDEFAAFTTLDAALEALFQEVSK